MHGRRQFVVWIVPLSGLTNATLVVCYKCHTRPPAPLRISAKCKWKVESYKVQSRCICVYFLLSTLHFITSTFVSEQRCGRKERMTPGQHVPLIPWATHIIQWLLQRVATRRLWANRPKKASVRIGVCNSTPWSWNC